MCSFADLPDELVHRVLNACFPRPAGPVGMLDGLLRLLGGDAV